MAKTDKSHKLEMRKFVGTTNLQGKGMGKQDPDDGGPTTAQRSDDTEKKTRNIRAVIS